MRIVFLTSGVPDPAAGGGPRRSHQLLHELSSVFGAAQVTAVNGAELFPLPSGTTGILARAQARVRNARANPFQWRSGDRFGLRDLNAAGLARYREIVGAGGGPTAVIIEESRLASLLPINAALNASTVLAPWVYDALTMNLTDLVSAMARLRQGDSPAASRTVRSSMTSHGNEMIWGQQMAANWRLSLLEHRMLRACGAQSDYVPYYPVGEAEALLRTVHGERRPQAGLFVITGGGIAPNQMALQSFLSGLRREDIPADTRIVVAGTTELPAEWRGHLGGAVEHVGRLSANDFHALLCRAHFLLIPQTHGFGCQTRVADMLCAGVPMLAGAQVEAGVGAVPGVRFVADTPDGWRNAIREARGTAPVITAAEIFTGWQSAQRWLVREALTRLAGRGA